MVQLTALSACLQDLFGPVADFLASWVGFIVRRRVLTGSAVARACVFRWMADPRATLEAIADDLGVSAQALQQHLGPTAPPFFKALIAEALARLGKARFHAHSLGMLGAFPAVVVEDCTTVSLPASLAHLFPGCGGKEVDHGAAALKIVLRYELKAGKILELSFHPGRRKDAAVAALPKDLPTGCLYLADMGFFGAARLGVVGMSCYWITRIPATTCVRVGGGLWQSLGEWLRGLRQDTVDVSGELAKSVGTPCRLVALRCPQEVAAQRRRKLREQRLRKDGKEPSAAQLTACDWTCFATNVPATLLGPRDVWTAYRCRWQIEITHPDYRPSDKPGCSRRPPCPGRVRLATTRAMASGFPAPHAWRLRMATPRRPSHAPKNGRPPRRLRIRSGNTSRRSSNTNSTCS